MNCYRKFWQYCLAGLLLLVPAWATLLILSTLFTTLDELIVALFGDHVKSDIPGLGILTLLLVLVLSGAIVTHVVGQRLFRWAEERVERIPLIRSVYLTLKGMADLFNFRSRFGRSTVVVFPFPRDGLWALGFVMGTAPASLQVSSLADLVMVFVPTAIHPFTGYLAFVPRNQVRPINLPPEDAMKMEFSAGFYRPRGGWLESSTRGL
ncbi:MAG: DUF502 domain-containing protein [Nitrospiraceae bacterium]